MEFLNSILRNSQFCYCSRYILKKLGSQMKATVNKFGKRDKLKRGFAKICPVQRC